MNTTTSTSKNTLASDVEIKGNLKFSGELTFDGKLDGEIHSDGLLTLGDSAVVSGNINANTVVVRGKITGNINAKEKIEIKTKAELFGDIRAAKLVVEEGVTFVGKTEVNPNKVSPTPPAPRPGRVGERPRAPQAATALNAASPPGRQALNAREHAAGQDHGSLPPLRTFPGGAAHRLLDLLQNMRWPFPVARSRPAATPRDRPPGPRTEADHLFRMRRGTGSPGVRSIHHVQAV